MRACGQAVCSSPRNAALRLAGTASERKRRLMFGWLKHHWKGVLLGTAAALAVAGIVAAVVVGAPVLAAVGTAAAAVAATTAGRMLLGAAIGAAVNCGAYAGIQ